MCKAFFRYPGIFNCLLLLRLVGSSVHVLWDLMLTVGFKAVSSDWAFFFFFFLENPVLCTFIFPLVLTAFPKEEPFGLPPADTWRVWASLLDLVGQKSEFSPFSV